MSRIKLTSISHQLPSVAVRNGQKSAIHGGFPPRSTAAATHTVSAFVSLQTARFARCLRGHPWPHARISHLCGEISGLISFFAFLLVFFGCGSKAIEERYGADSRIAAAGNAAATEGKSSSIALPWDIVAYGRDLQGNSLKSALLLQGDELLQAGDYLRALERYASADPGKLPPAEREIRAYRSASAQLAARRSKEALNALSAYFRAQGKAETEVPQPFALLFAFAYGDLEDYDQSLAWFSKTAAAGAMPAAHAAEQGLKLLLRTLSEERFEKLAAAWQGDAFVRTQTAHERYLSARSTAIALNRNVPFWQVSLASAGAAQNVEHAINGQTSSPQSMVGVILPLSGPYASLGLATKNGIEIALAGFKSHYTDTPAAISYIDDGGDAYQAAAGVRELVRTHGASIILGPLLTDAAMRVSEVAREEATPIVTFSKSSVFSPGNGVFRLGPTAQDQVHSLLEAAYAEFGLQRVAAVFPDDSGGQEFAEAFREECGKRGMQLVLEVSYPRGVTDGLMRIAQDVEQSDAQAVFFPDSLKAATRFFSYLASSQNRVRALGTASWDNLAELMQSQAVLHGAIFVSPFFSRSARSDVSQFVESFRSRFGAAPDFMAAQGFDAATIAFDAVQRSRQQQISVLNAILGISNYDGITGQAQVSTSGEIRRRFAVVAFEQGNLREVGLPGDMR